MYVIVPVVDVLIVADDQVPVIPFVEVDAKAGVVLFWQSGPMASKVGVMLLVMAISIVTVVAH